jgi:hypothetical protein
MASESFHPPVDLGVGDAFFNAPSLATGGAECVEDLEWMPSNERKGGARWTIGSLFIA